MSSWSKFSLVPIAYARIQTKDLKIDVLQTHPHFFLQAWFFRVNSLQPTNFVLSVESRLLWSSASNSFLRDCIYRKNLARKFSIYPRRKIAALHQKSLDSAEGTNWYRVAENLPWKKSYPKKKTGDSERFQYFWGTFVKSLWTLVWCSGSTWTVFAASTLHPPLRRIFFLLVSGEIFWPLFQDPAPLRILNNTPTKERHLVPYGTSLPFVNDQQERRGTLIAKELIES